MIWHYRRPFTAEGATVTGLEAEHERHHHRNRFWLLAEVLEHEKKHRHHREEKKEEKPKLPKIEPYKPTHVNIGLILARHYHRLPKLYLSPLSSETSRSRRHVEDEKKKEHEQHREEKTGEEGRLACPFNINIKSLTTPTIAKITEKEFEKAEKKTEKAPAPPKLPKLSTSNNLPTAWLPEGIERHGRWIRPSLSTVKKIGEPYPAKIDLTINKLREIEKKYHVDLSSTLSALEELKRYGNITGSHKIVESAEKIADLLSKGRILRHGKNYLIVEYDGKIYSIVLAGQVPIIESLEHRKEEIYASGLYWRKLPKVESAEKTFKKQLHKELEKVGEEVSKTVNELLFPKSLKEKYLGKIRQLEAKIHNIEKKYGISINIHGNRIVLSYGSDSLVIENGKLVAVYENGRRINPDTDYSKFRNIIRRVLDQYEKYRREARKILAEIGKTQQEYYHELRKHWKNLEKKYGIKVKVETEKHGNKIETSYTISGNINTIILPGSNISAGLYNYIGEKAREIVKEAETAKKTLEEEVSLVERYVNSNSFKTATDTECRRLLKNLDKLEKEAGKLGDVSLLEKIRKIKEKVEKQLNYATSVRENIQKELSNPVEAGLVGIVSELGGVLHGLTKGLEELAEALGDKSLAKYFKETNRYWSTAFKEMAKGEAKPGGLWSKIAFNIGTGLGSLAGSITELPYTLALALGYKATHNKELAKLLAPALEAMSARRKYEYGIPLPVDIRFKVPYLGTVDLGKKIAVEDIAPLVFDIAGGVLKLGASIADRLGIESLADVFSSLGEHVLEIGHSLPDIVLMDKILEYGKEGISRLLSALRDLARREGKSEAEILAEKLGISSTDAERLLDRFREMEDYIDRLRRWLKKHSRIETEVPSLEVEEHGEEIHLRISRERMKIPSKVGALMQVLSGGGESELHIAVPSEAEKLLHAEIGLARGREGEYIPLLAVAGRREELEQFLPREFLEDLLRRRSKRVGLYMAVTGEGKVLYGEKLLEDIYERLRENPELLKKLATNLEDVKKLLRIGRLVAEGEASPRSLEEMLDRLASRGLLSPEDVEEIEHLLREGRLGEAVEKVPTLVKKIYRRLAEETASELFPEEKEVAYRVGKAVRKTIGEKIEEYREHVPHIIEEREEEIRRIAERYRFHEGRFEVPLDLEHPEEARVRIENKLPTLEEEHVEKISNRVRRILEESGLSIEEADRISREVRNILEKARRGELSYRDARELIEDVLERYGVSRENVEKILKEVEENLPKGRYRLEARYRVNLPLHSVEAEERIGEEYSSLGLGRSEGYVFHREERTLGELEGEVLKMRKEVRNVLKGLKESEKAVETVSEESLTPTEKIAKTIELYGLGTGEHGKLRFGELEIELPASREEIEKTLAKRLEAYYRLRELSGKIEKLMKDLSSRDVRELYRELESNLEKLTGTGAEYLEEIRRARFALKDVRRLLKEAEKNSSLLAEARSRIEKLVKYLAENLPETEEEYRKSMMLEAEKYFSSLSPETRRRLVEELEKILKVSEPSEAFDRLEKLLEEYDKTGKVGFLHRIEEALKEDEIRLRRLVSSSFDKTVSELSPEDRELLEKLLAERISEREGISFEDALKRAEEILEENPETKLRTLYEKYGLGDILEEEKEKLRRLAKALRGEERAVEEAGENAPEVLKTEEERSAEKGIEVRSEEKTSTVLEEGEEHATTRIESTEHSVTIGLGENSLRIEGGLVEHVGDDVFIRIGDRTIPIKLGDDYARIDYIDGRLVLVAPDGEKLPIRVESIQDSIITGRIEIGGKSLEVSFRMPRRLSSLAVARGVVELEGTVREVGEKTGETGLEKTITRTGRETGKSSLIEVTASPLTIEELKLMVKKGEIFNFIKDVFKGIEKPIIVTLTEAENVTMLIDLLKAIYRLALASLGLELHFIVRQIGRHTYEINMVPVKKLLPSYPKPSIAITATAGSSIGTRTVSSEASEEEEKPVITFVAGSSTGIEEPSLKLGTVTLAGVATSLIQSTVPIEAEAGKEKAVEEHGRTVKGGTGEEEEKPRRLRANVTGGAISTGAGLPSIGVPTREELYLAL